MGGNIAILEIFNEINDFNNLKLTYKLITNCKETFDFILPKKCTDAQA